MNKVTNKGFYDGYVASVYWSTNKLSAPTHYRGYVILQELDIEELKHFGSVLITCFSVDGLGDVYPSYRQDFTPISFDLSKDKPIGKHPYGNELALVFEDDAPPNTEKPLSENSLLLNIESDKQKQELEERRKEHDERIKQFFPEKESQLDESTEDVFFSVGNYRAFAEKSGANLTVDWVHWLIVQEWTKEQAAYLICEIDPNNNHFEKPSEPVTKIIQRCYADLKLDQAPPIVWLEWFNKVGLLDESGKLASWLNEQLTEKELTGDLSQDDANWNHQVNNSEPQVKKIKPRKKLKSPERDTDYGSLLICKILEANNVQYLDELKGNDAWLLIVSGDYKNDDLIKSISENKTYITLKDDVKFEKRVFLDRYRKRFISVKN